MILTYNEEIHIEKCIESAQFADEIIVIDSGSTDKTVEIAKGKRAKVVHHPMTDGFAAQRNFAYSCTEAEWVLYLDADERITSELAKEISELVKKNRKFCYAVPRRFMMYGRWVRHGGLYQDYTLRLFPRMCSLVWQGSIHESAKVSIPTQKLSNALLHYGFRGWESHLNKDNRYTSMLASKLNQEGKKASVFDMITHSSWAFFRMYIFRSGWRDGVVGLVLASMRYFYVLQKYVKLYFEGKDVFQKPNE